MKITFADQDQIQHFEETATAFFRDILAMDYANMFVSDESTLSDFASCGDMPDDGQDDSRTLEEVYQRWGKWVLQRIHDYYGIEVSTTGIYLVTLFHQIEQAKAAKVH